MDFTSLRAIFADLSAVKTTCAVKTAFAILLLAGLTGCGQPFWLPPAHKIEVQQGNLVSQGQRDRMQLGMSREAIVAIAGEPLAGNAFHGDRWDYLFTRGPAGK